MNTQLIAQRIIHTYEPTKAHVIEEILSGFDRQVRNEIHARVLVGWIINDKKKGNENEKVN